MKKKIATLSFYHGRYLRGVESWVSGLETHLSSDFEIKIFSHKSVSSLKIDWNKNQSKSSLFRRFFFDYWSLKIFEFNIKLLPQIIKFSPDIILATAGGWEVAIMRILTWITGAKLVIAGQAGIGWDEYNNLYSFPDCFVALTQKAKTWAKKNNPIIKVVKIPNAVDTNKFKPVNRTVSKTKKILTVGALEKGKRIDKIIEAVSKIKNARLTIIGDGPEKDNLHKLAKRFNLETKIKTVKHSEIYKEFSKADLFVSASESYYAFEIVIIEALATNLPVCANDDEIRKEIVGKAGILSEPENTVKFAEDIGKALNTNWKNKPRMQSEKFSWEKVSKEYKNLFNSL